MIEVVQPSAVPAAVARARALDLVDAQARSPRQFRKWQERHAERERERMAYADQLARERTYWAGTPLCFEAVSMFGVGASPLTFPSAATLRSWHLSTRGVTLGAQVIPTIGTDPAVSFSSNINQSVPARLDVLTGGLRGVATYGLTIDGGLSYFQSGVTATTVPVAAFGQSMTMNAGTYTAGNTYAFVVVSIDPQSPLPGTLAGEAGVTDANRPRILPLVQNGYPSIKGAGGTLAGLVDTTSTWAADVCSGVQKDFTLAFCMADDTAVPTSAVAFISFADNTLPNPIYSFNVRNGTNVYRCAHVTDSNVTTNREAGALDTAFHVFVVQQSGGLVSAWVDGANIVNGLSWGTAVQTTCSNVGLFCTRKGGVQIGADRFQFLEMMTYTSALATSPRQQLEGYLKGKYATP